VILFLTRSVPVPITEYLGKQDFLQLGEIGQLSPALLEDTNCPYNLARSLAIFGRAN
jgi:hypothetical protein